MGTRKSISKKLRFEVFKRDSFRCQYCGAEAPNVLLHVDHILPVAEGGSNDITNLVTSCEPCNAGKGARKLDDNSAIAKSKAQLDELQARREQLELLMEWKRGLSDLSNETLDQVHSYFESCTGCRVQTPAARADLGKLVRKYGASEVLNAIDAGIESYAEYSDGPTILTVESANKLWFKLPGICRVLRASKDDPDARELYYIRGIMRNRYSYVNPAIAMKLMRAAREVGISIAELREIVFQESYWTAWQDAIEERIAEES